jgi:hypothetical protein
VQYVVWDGDDPPVELRPGVTVYRIVPDDGDIELDPLQPD